MKASEFASLPIGQVVSAVVTYSRHCWLAAMLINLTTKRIRYVSVISCKKGRLAMESFWVNE